jgi:PncC family amidohydrolase
MLIRKLDHNGTEKARYEGDVITRDEHSVVIRATWTRPTVRLGFATFEKGDVLRETFYDDRWYNVFELFNAQGQLKGWYADVTRPAHITSDTIDWEDLILDIWMSPDGSMQVLDEDEFASSRHELSDADVAIAHTALGELRDELLCRWRAYANDRIAQVLTQRHWSIGTAESCTGGLIGDTLTNRSGSSEYFLGGIICYDNRIKRDVLGVREETLRQAGAVSEACALEMAEGVRRALGLDMGISATGIAGPGGGSAEKPVGLVYIGISAPHGDLVQRFIWPYDRMGNKRATADAALKLLMDCLVNEAVKPDGQK